jgi:hypothetical protein
MTTLAIGVARSPHRTHAKDQGGTAVVAASACTTATAPPSRQATRWDGVDRRQEQRRSMGSVLRYSWAPACRGGCDRVQVVDALHHAQPDVFTGGEVVPAKSWRMTATASLRRRRHLPRRPTRRDLTPPHVRPASRHSGLLSLIPRKNGQPVVDEVVDVVVRGAQSGVSRASSSRSSAPWSAPDWFRERTSSSQRRCRTRDYAAGRGSRSLTGCVPGRDQSR